MFRYSMTLRGGNPQALMLPAECLQHYHVDSYADRPAEAAAHAHLARSGVPVRVGQWLRSVLHRDAD